MASETKNARSTRACETISTPRPSAAWLRIEMDAGSETDLTKVRCSCGWNGRTRCGTRRRSTVNVPRLHGEEAQAVSDEAPTDARPAGDNVHRVFDGRGEGLAADDSDERAGELDDVRLDAGLGRAEDEVADTERGLLPLVVRAARKGRARRRSAQ